MEGEKDTIEIDLLALLRAVWKRIWVVIAAVVVGAVMAFSYANFFITPLYTSTALMYVNNSSISLGSTSFSITSGELSAAQSLVDTYIVIMKSRLTMNAVIEEADLSYTYDELVPMITASSVNGTEIFKISVTDADPQEAELIANTVAKILPDKITDIVEGASVRIVDYAIVPAYKASPSVTRYTMIGCLLGAVLSIGVLVVMELLNESIRSEDYLIQTYNLPILAVVPAMGTQDKTQGGYGLYQTATKVKRGKH